MKTSTDVWTVSVQHGIAESLENPLARSHENLPSFQPYSTAFDVVIGTANDLIEAGLVALHELPGQLGRNRFMCTYPPDGHPGQSKDKRSKIYMPGCRRITRSGSEKYRVQIAVTEEERQKRRQRELDRCRAFFPESARQAIAAHDHRIRLGEAMYALVMEKRHLTLVHGKKS